MTWRELLLTSGGLMASAFALARLTLVGRFKLIEQLLAMVDGSLKRQETIQSRLADSVGELRENLGENTAMLRRLNDRL
ncbi:MAG: hypothetical protein K8R88_07475 [Armatimonadetes bacterium]|nr:hypothetical protein [Armatimonadota bacterium]